MKTVHTPDMVAHLWAAQGQPRARNAGDTFYFEGDTIYSYGRHFPIARIVTEGTGHKYRKTVFMTLGEYSITTAKHKAIVRSAVRHLHTIYVPRVDYDNADNLRTLEEQFKEQMIAAAGKHKGRATEIAMAKAAHTLDLRNALALYMGRKAKPMPQDFTKAAKAEAEKRAKADKATRERLKAERLDSLAQKEADMGATFKHWGDVWARGISQDGVNRYTYERFAAIASERDGVEYPTSLPVLLRLLPNDLDQVQTSLGATVPLDHAHRIYRMWARLQAKMPPEGWTNTGDSQEGKVGAFRVDWIDPDGTLHAGCHTIRPEAIRDFAQRMGWEG